MFKYAQLDETGKCISISFLSGEVESSNMILLGNEVEINLNDTYANGVWSPSTVTIEPPPDRISALEVQNADLNLQIIDLFEQLLNKGVL